MARLRFLLLAVAAMASTMGAAPMATASVIQFDPAIIIGGLRAPDPARAGFAAGDAARDAAFALDSGGGLGHAIAVSDAGGGLAPSWPRLAVLGLPGLATVVSAEAAAGGAAPRTLALGDADVLPAFSSDFDFAALVTPPRDAADGFLVRDGSAQLEIVFDEAAWERAEASVDDRETSRPD